MPRVLAACALVAGVAAWTFYFSQDLVLSHYDAKAHLVVARRIFDSLTPGWQQIGAVWLPLPHLLQALPTQIDALYRTGAFGSAISIGSFGVTVWALSRLAIRATGSRVGGLTTGALLLANPNLLYLHATPMTEPLLLAVGGLVVLWTYDWLERAQDPGGDPGPAPVKLRVAAAAAVWTRYEGWLIVGALVAAAGWIVWRSGSRPASAARRAIGLAAWPAVAIVLVLVNSRATVGVWFVTGGFYVADPMYEARPLIDLVGVWWAANQLGGFVPGTMALVAGGVVLWRAVCQRRDVLLVPPAMLAAAALPFYGLLQGHPYRVRYGVPILAAFTLLSGLAVGMLDRATGGDSMPAAAGNRRRAWLLALGVLVAALIEAPPWSQQAALLEEARWDVPVSRARQPVRQCLADAYRGETVLASMGSLAHVMQELSRDGLDLADFLHEGNGDRWQRALEEGPARHVGWMLVEEESEGGDVLARRIRSDASFAAGMVRRCAGGGVALYVRQ